MQFLLRVLAEHRLYRILFTFLVFVFVTSCSVTKHVPYGMYLLNKVEVKSKSKEVKSDEILSYVKQKPNKRILGFRFHLRLYSLSNPQKSGWLSRGLRQIGEDPVLFDSLVVKESSRNIKLFLQSKGYYNSVVKDSIRYHGKKVDVFYTVEPRSPYHIRKIGYYIEDTTIRNLVLRDSVNRIFNRNDLFDIDLLQNERERIEILLKEKGFYSFDKNYITFTADTNLQGNYVDLNLIIKNPAKPNPKGKPVPLKFKRYKIRRVYIYPNYDPFKFDTFIENSQLDTISNNECYFVYHDKPGIKLSVIQSFNLIRPDSVFSLSRVNRTRQNLSQIRLFKFVNIEFREVDVFNKKDSLKVIFLDDSIDVDEDFGYLDCYIQLVPHTLQSYQVELVGTNTTGSLGAEGTLNYQHKNLLNGAELFDVKLRGLVETVLQNLNLHNTLEIGGSMSLKTPKFIGPYSSKVRVDKYAPNTQFTASYSFQRRPEYTRMITGLQYGYIWKSSQFSTHTLNPVELNAITIKEISSDFQEQIDSTFLKYSYISQIVTVSSYSWVYSNQNPKKLSNYNYLRFNFELSGNILSAISKLTGRSKNSNGSYEFFNTEFSQFARTEVNYTFHQIVDENNSFAYRFYIGLGYPYGNSRALPFEKRFFSGGANGIRAWQARSLGPGSYYQELERFPNRTADIKLEANFEYRYRLVWKLEGALFVDVGNIWSWPGLDERQGATFKWDKFYEQIAIGSGLGIRMNLGFFIIRTDFGYKIFDPAINPNEPYNPWVGFNQPLKINKFVFNFGIGYPF